MIPNTHPTVPIPTRASILRDFERCVKLGDDREFQYARVVRRWQACGYPMQELTLLFTREVTA